MTVRELIAELETLDPDKEILVDTSEAKEYDVILDIVGVRIAPPHIFIEAR